MLVSVLMPIYRHERYVTAALESILTQTGADLEVVAVDDGSPDDSLRLARAVAAKDQRVRVLTHPGNENRGVSATLRLALEHATGDVIAVCASDDEWSPSGLCNRLAALEGHDWAYGRVDVVDEQAYGTGQRWGDPPRTRLLEQVLTRNPVPALSLTARRTTLDLVGAYDFDEVYEDLALVLRLAAIAPAGFCAESVGRYRRSDAGAHQTARMQGRTLHHTVSALRSFTDWLSPSDPRLPMAQEYLHSWEFLAEWMANRTPPPRPAPAHLRTLLAHHWPDLDALDCTSPGYAQLPAGVRATMTWRRRRAHLVTKVRSRKSQRVKAGVR